MELSPNAPVYCGDERVGRAHAVIFHPRSHRVTHLVVEAQHVRRLVPVEEVASASKERITLRRCPADLSSFEPFLDLEWLETPLPPRLAGWEYGYAWPLAFPDENVPHDVVWHERIPLHERKLKRGMRVVASDGRVGSVDELLVDEGGEHITHLVLREGHLLNRKRVAVPVSQVKRFEDDCVNLSLSKHEVEALPEVATGLA